MRSSNNIDELHSQRQWQSETKIVLTLEVPPTHQFIVLTRSFVRCFPSGAKFLDRLRNKLLIIPISCCDHLQLRHIVRSIWQTHLQVYHFWHGMKPNTDEPLVHDPSSYTPHTIYLDYFGKRDPRKGNPQWRSLVLGRVWCHFRFDSGFPGLACWLAGWDWLTSCCCVL